MDIRLGQNAALSLLTEQFEAGIDEPLENNSMDWFSLFRENKNSAKILLAGEALPSKAPSLGTTPAPSKKVPPNDSRTRDKTNPSHNPSHIAYTARDLGELEALLQKFEGCSLKKTATKTVFADGNPDSGIMLIGEAPGAEEDRVGKPFVGPAGQLLNLMLDSIGLNREKVYITNVCFWRPPGNRKPSDAEWAACQPFTLKHIQLIKPRAILLLGGSAAQQILNVTEGITRLRGQWLELKIAESIPSIPTLATFHPAYLLRQPAAKKESWLDFLSFHKKIK